MSLTQKSSHDVSVYRPRSSTQTALYKLLAEHFDHFETVYPERFSKSHGFYRQVISHVVWNYLWCGYLTHGFARVRCPTATMSTCWLSSAEGAGYDELIYSRD